MTEASHVKLEAIQGNGGWASAAELNVFRALLPSKNSTEMKAVVERFEEEGAFKSDSDARLLKTHLTVVNRYEEKELADKVVKHLESFKRLLDHQKENELISEMAYDILYADTETVIKNWQ